MNNEIQFLRALAIILVYVSHLHGLFFFNEAYWRNVGKGLWVGVDLFFCVSGYVISRNLVERLQNQTGDYFWREVTAFWVRRLYRITPSAWLWLLIPVALSPFFNEKNAFSAQLQNIPDVAAAVMHMANFHYYSCTVGGGYCGVFSTYWSLSLEEQFYLLFPFLILIFGNQLYKALIVLVLMQIFITRHQWGGLLSFIRTDAILLGVLIAIFSSKVSYKIFEPNLNSSRFRFIISPLLIFCLVMTVRHELVQFYIGLAAMVCAVIVWMSSYNKGYFVKNKFLLKPMAWIGARSFSIYLCHIPLFWVTREIWKRIEADGFEFNSTYTLRFFITSIILTLIIADLNYRFLEEPMRKIGLKHSKNILEKNIHKA